MDNNKIFRVYSCQLHSYANPISCLWSNYTCADTHKHKHVHDRQTCPWQTNCPYCLHYCPPYRSGRSWGWCGTGRGLQSATHSSCWGDTGQGRRDSGWFRQPDQCTLHRHLKVHIKISSTTDPIPSAGTVSLLICSTGTSTRVVNNILWKTHKVLIR